MIISQVSYRTNGWIKLDTHSYLMCFHSFVLPYSLGNSLLSVSHFTSVFVGEEITICSVIVPDFHVNILGQLSVLKFSMLKLI